MPQPQHKVSLEVDGRMFNLNASAVYIEKNDDEAPRVIINLAPRELPCLGELLERFRNQR